MLLSTIKRGHGTGFLDGQFLIAMPQVTDWYFVRSVVYICAHSPAGAMGFVINRLQKKLTFSEVLLNINIFKYDDTSLPIENSNQIPILSGGPVEASCGFVLHSDEYIRDSSIFVSRNIFLTATVDIVRAILQGTGPKQSVIMFGYAGWIAGQLEAEIAQNSWLTCPAVDDIIFSIDFDEKYKKALSLLGINSAMLLSQAGHA